MRKTKREKELESLVGDLAYALRRSVEMLEEVETRPEMSSDDWNDHLYISRSYLERADEILEKQQ